MASNLQFVSWSRRGIGAAVPVGQVGSRLQVKTAVVVSADRKDAARTEQELSSAPMAVLGPGDAVGVDPTYIVRRTPRSGDHQLEPNYLLGIEFAHPDLPWMFSPTGPAGAEHADPWLMLLAIDVEPGHVQGAITSRPGSPNPVLVLDDPDAVGDPANAWAFAHVQVHNVDAPQALTTLRGPNAQAGNVRSRVICPTRLLPEHAYIAALVPVYEAGRRVGLGLAETDAGAARWVAAPGLQLPVYDFWRLRTGPSGDFETLARKLQPLNLNSDVFKRLGLRRVAIEPKAALMQRAEDPDLFARTVHEIPTAIAKSDRPGPLAPDSPAPDPAAADLHRRLKELVDIVAAATDAEPIVGPPLYGRWAAEVTSLDADPGNAELVAVPFGTAQTWIEQLNADPHLRAAAGVATRVVQRDQETLMTDAWSQLADVLAANRRMRWAHLFAHSSGPLHARLGAASATGALRVTASALGRLRAGDGLTVRAEIEASTLPREAIGSALARTARFAVRATRADAIPATVSTTVSRAVESLGLSAPDVLPARFTTTRAIDASVLKEVLADDDLSNRIRTRLGSDPAEYLERIDQVPDTVTRIAGDFADEPMLDAGAETPDATRVIIDPSLDDRVNRLSELANDLQQRGTVRLDRSVQSELRAFQAGGSRGLSLHTVETLNQLAAREPVQGVEAIDLTHDAVRVSVGTKITGTLGSIATAAGIGEQRALIAGTADGLRTAALTGLGVATPRLVDLIGALDDADDQLVRRGVRDVARTVTALGAAVAVPELARFDIGISASVVTALEPVAAYQKMLSFAHSEISDLVRRRPNSQFHPAMASPHFPAPLVERLKTFDQEWVLGGVSQLPPNSVCLLEVNWRFVEAFLAGANHEMARELLWRGYPTDLRGTCFQQFWGAPVPDIARMDSWRGPIGAHPAVPPRKELTMLVIKGDLLRRYPSTLISAEKGTTSALVGDTQFVSDGLFGKELFRGFLGADVSYSALDIAPATLRETDPANHRHCWYISLLEPHDEPRFGLDEQPTDAPGANRNTLVGAGFDYSRSDDWSWQGLANPAIKHLDPGAVFANDSSAVVGASLFQIPFRLLLRAPDYLPPEA